MLTSTQKKTTEAIVNLFETSEVLGDYSKVTVLPGDTGHLTFGRSQTTLGSGNLHELLRRYCANPGARFGARLAPSLSRFEEGDLTLDGDIRVQNLLRATADDPVMRDTQDAFFDETYWQPAAREGERAGIASPLGIAVVYDSFVHGSWRKIRDRTTEQVGDVASVGEQAWIAAYVAKRRDWLATNPNSLLRSTVYRMDSFQRLIDQGYWGLDLPLVVRDREISTVTLSALPPRCYSGPLPGTRMLAVEQPLQSGLDIRLVQLGLSDLGANIKADGIYGRTSQGCIREYQLAQGLPATGIADVALIARLTSGLM